MQRTLNNATANAKDMQLYYDTDTGKNILKIQEGRKLTYTANKGINTDNKYHLKKNVQSISTLQTYHQERFFKNVSTSFVVTSEYIA